MDSRNEWMSELDELQRDYPLLKRLAAVDFCRNDRQAVHTQSTESLKRKLTNRTGYSEHSNSLLLKPEGEADQIVEQTFCNIENVEHVNIPECQLPTGCIFRMKIVVDRRSRVVEVADGNSFQDILEEVEALVGRKLSLPALTKFVEAIQLSSTSFHSTQVIPPGESSSQKQPRRTHRDRSKENRQNLEQAAIIRHRKRMILNYGEKTLYQDIDHFCITHKLSDAEKRLIRRALKKGEKLINLS